MAEYIIKQKVTDRMGCCLAYAKAEYKAAKDEFTKARFGDYILSIQAMIDVVKCSEAEDVQPVDRWTSVDEALPPDNKACVVMTKNNGLGVSRLMGRNRIEWTLFGEPVLYWLPIPEPPKDGDTKCQ